MLVPLTPVDLKRRAVRLFARKVGVVDGPRRFTYAEFGERTHRLANALIARGLERGDRVATLAFNSHALLEAYYGVLEAGGVLLPINVRLSPAEVARIVEHAGARFLLVDAELAQLTGTIPAATAPTLIWIGSRPTGRSEDLYEEMLEGASPAPPPPLDIDENDVAELFYTSGTTGDPRGVMLTHRNLYLHAMGVLVTLRASERDVQLHTISLFHVNGWGTPQAITAVGGTHVMLRKFDPGEVLKLIEQERVTRIFVVPTMLNMILHHEDVGRRDLSSLELVNTGGAPTPPDMVRRGERILGCRVVSGYGLTETSPMICFASEKSYLAGDDDEARIRRQASTGMPLIGTELTIVDSSGRELPWDGRAVGEIVVRSNVVTSGYFHDPEATAQAMVDGWFHTGDLATIDPEGYVLIVDRAKDIIVSGGENVSSIAVERTLYGHPDVLECAVIAVPDERWGEAVKAVVVLGPDAKATELSLLDFCSARLASFEVPKSIAFVDNLPKGGTGKILKRELREAYWKGYHKRVH